VTGKAPGCLPAGTVRIAAQEEPDTIQLSWYPPGKDGQALMIGSALHRG
jgi:hypothetical protein